MYGFACFFAGFLIFIIFINIIYFVQLPGYYIDHEYYSNTEDLEQFQIRLYYKLIYFVLLVGTFILIFTIEYNIKNTKYLITVLNIALLIWYAIAAVKYFEIVTYFIYLWCLNLLIFWIILFYFAKWAKIEFKAISAYIFLGTWIILVSFILGGYVIRALGTFPISLSPILTIIGSLICLLPTLLTPTYLSKARIHWIIIGVLIVGFTSLLLIFIIIFQLPSVYLVLGIVFETTVILIAYRMIIVTKSTSIIATKKEQSIDILSAFTRPQKLTEEEVSVSREKRICLVCKGKVSRKMYICPNCNTFYCKKCSDTLSTLENACWVCETPFDESKPVKLPEKKEEEIIVEDDIHKTKKKAKN